MIKFPKFPAKGDTIGIFAPSAGVGYKLNSFDKSLETLKKEGYKIKETDSIRNASQRSTDAITRAAELSSLLSDDDVSCIISASGGDFCFEMMPYIDDKLFLENPKWICGASDPTNILYYLTTKHHVATMYGFNAGSFDDAPHRYINYALNTLKGDIQKQESFELYARNFDFMADEIVYDTPVEWILSGDKSELCETGTLIGGCIDCISNILGTPYDYTKNFISAYDDIIWYFDPFAMNSETLYMTMLKMKYMGYFENTKAVIFGRIMFKMGSDDNSYIEELKLCFEDIPFIWNADIGHVKPCMTLINGSTATVSCKDGKGSIEMKLK